jgi:hypothetical protein
LDYGTTTSDWQDGGSPVGRRDPEAFGRSGGKRLNGKRVLRDVRACRATLLLLDEEVPIETGRRGRGFAMVEVVPAVVPGRPQLFAEVGSIRLYK